MPQPFTFLCCPDSFKGTATAPEVASALAEGIRATGHRALIAPFADGGEGTAEILAKAISTTPREHRVDTVDALGRDTRASWWQAGRQAFLDIAAASGLPAVADSLEPRRATTYGSGLVLREVLKMAPDEIDTVTICLGGSATTDGGVGLLLGLGAELYDEHGNRVAGGTVPRDDLSMILKAQHVNLPRWLHERDLSPLTWQLACDVKVTPLECVTVFGPQKGATEDDVKSLTTVMEHWCRITNTDVHGSGYGAAGACAVGLSFLARELVCTLSLRSGAELVADAYRLNEKLQSSHFLITGEGHVDKQSHLGKVVGFLCNRARACQVPVGIVAGKIDVDAPVLAEARYTAQLSGSVERTLPDITKAGSEIAAALIKVSK